MPVCQNCSGSQLFSKSFKDLKLKSQVVRNTRSGFGGIHLNIFDRMLYVEKVISFDGQAAEEELRILVGGWSMVGAPT